MITKNSFFRINDLYKVQTTEELRQQYVEFKNSNAMQANSFYLVHKDFIHPNHLILLDLATVNCLFSASKPTRVLHDSTINTKLVRSLVCDGILEVRKTDGTFCSGASCFSQKDFFLNTTSSTSNLSTNCIKHAWFFKDLALEELIEKLYAFGYMPLTHTLINRFSSPEKIVDWLQVDSIDAFQRNYNFHPITPKNKHWLYWQHKDFTTNDELLYKLYVSPNPEELPTVFQKVAATCIKLSTPIFKLGSTTRGIHRPDKMVLYFKTKNALLSFAKMLKPILTKYKAQGVPFTYSLTENGMLSYGIEPTEGYTTSFRLYISTILAKTLKTHAFKNTKLNLHEVLLQLNIHGIKTQKWTYHAHK